MSLLIHGDAINIPMKDESVDMIFADPPFNIGLRYIGQTDKREDYYPWCEKWIDECFRVLKNTGTFYLMTMDRHLEKLFPMIGSRGKFINLIQWRNVSAFHNKRGFWSTFQPIMMYGKSENYKFNTYAQVRKISELNYIPNLQNLHTSKPKGQLLDYWGDIPNVYTGAIKHPEAILKPGLNKKLHPCQMPVNLAVRCVVFSTDEGDIVLDPFMGSGSTAVACEKVNRQFIGMDIAIEYIEMTRKRLNNPQIRML